MKVIDWLFDKGLIWLAGGAGGWFLISWNQAYAISGRFLGLLFFTIAYLLTVWSVSRERVEHLLTVLNQGADMLDRIVEEIEKKENQ